MNDPADLPLPEAAARLREGELTSVGLVEAALARIARFDGAIHAVVALDREAALRQAALADSERAQGRDLGPLHGVPIAIKDLIDVEGLPCACGSASRRGFMPMRDAEAVARLRAAGAVILGKVATYEFALVGPDLSRPDPVARNPWDVRRITGGSSSGSAAAVAAGYVRAALGTDSGGSVRSPAAYCGVVGMKPSFGRVSTAGVFPLSPTLDHVGPLAASVEEAALVLDAMTEPGAAQAWRPASGLLGRDLRGLRIGYARAWFAGDPEAEPALVGAMDAAASQLSLLGARIEEIELPPYARFEATASLILQAEALAIHRLGLGDHPELYGRPARQTLAWGAAIAPGDVATARRAAQLLSQQLQRCLAGFDAAITATALSVAPPLSAFAQGKAVWTPMRTIAFNLTGNPALSLPIGFAGGLPYGMQIVGGLGDDDAICRIGFAFERATDASAQRPSLPR